MVLADFKKVTEIKIEKWRLVSKPVVPRCSFYTFEVYQGSSYLGLYSSWTPNPTRKKDLLPLTDEQYERIGNPLLSFP
jgi:hypothetical protein